MSDLPFVEGGAGLVSEVGGLGGAGAFFKCVEGAGNSVHIVVEGLRVDGGAGVGLGEFHHLARPHLLGNNAGVGKHFGDGVVAAGATVCGG